MSEFRLSPEAEAELDGIWMHIALEGGSIDIATRVVESITERFWLLARYPLWGVAATTICGPACGVSLPTITLSFTAS